MAEEFEQNEFNMAFSYLSRLNYSFWTINESKRKRNLTEWINELSVLTDELSTEKTILQKLPERTETLKQLMEEVDTLQIKTQRTGRNKVPINLYWKIIDYERWLRKAMDDAGLLKKMKESAMDALK